MECERHRERISRDIDRLTASDETNETRRHLTQCPECRRYYDEEVRMVALIAASVRPLRIREDLTDNIVRRLPEAEELPDLQTPGARLLWWGAGLAAAAAAMVIAGLFALSPEQGPLPPGNDDGKVHNVATPVGTPQETPQYDEQCIVIADVVAVDDKNIQVRVATALRGDSVSCRTIVGESAATRYERIQDPDGTFRWVEKTHPEPVYEWRTRSLSGATILFAAANARTIGAHRFTAGEKVVMTFPDLPTANIENDTIVVPETSVSRIFAWSATLEKEIREEIAKDEETLVWEMYDVTDLTARLGTVEKIVELVKQSVAPDSWAKPGRSIECMSGMLIVSQIRSVHREIKGFLAHQREGVEEKVLSFKGGNVLSYSRELNVVIINVGLDRGLREGMEITISRKGATVASGIAAKVDATLTVVQLKTKVADPLPGDGCRATEHASLKAYPNATILVRDSASGAVARVTNEGMQVVLENPSTGETLWKSTITSDAKIRHLEIKSGQLIATVGKHGFTVLDLRTGKVMDVGSD